MRFPAGLGGVVDKGVWNDDCCEEMLFPCSSVNVFLARFACKRKGKINQPFHVWTSFSAPKKILFDPSTKDVDAL